MQVVVDHHDRRGAAAREALDLFEREETVGRALAVADAEPGHERVTHVEGTAQRAREVPAHLEMPARRLLRPVHRVEGDDLPLNG